jgi:hypothetical protein
MLTRSASPSSTSTLARFALTFGLGGLVGCVGTTGGEQFAFDAYAAGVPGGDGVSHSFVQDRFGFAVTLTRATLTVGGVYLNRAVPTSVSNSSTTCTLPGIYSAEVPAVLDVNLLSGARQPFPALGQATSDPTNSAEIWLNHGDVNDPGQAPVILSIEGRAEKEGELYPFAGKLSIGANRSKEAPQASPGLYPICKERIVGPFAVHLEPQRGGHLVLGIDPESLFASVDFARLTPNRQGVFTFDDERETAEHPVDSASRALYAALTSTAPYTFFWNSN